MSISDSIWSNLLAPRSCHMHHGVPAPCHEKSSRDGALLKVCYDVSYIGYAHNPQVFARMLSKKKTHPNVFCLGFSQGGEKGKVTQKGWTTLNNDSSWWSSGLAVGCWGMGLGVEAWAFSNKRIFDSQTRTKTVTTYKQHNPHNSRQNCPKQQGRQVMGPAACWFLNPGSLMNRIQTYHDPVNDPKNTLINPWN